MKCYHCQAETTNGLALCDLGQGYAARCLEFLPIYFRNLARWQPGKAGARPVPASREPRTIANQVSDRVTDALDQAAADITDYAHKLATHHNLDLPASNDEQASVRVACWILTENLTSVATLDWCGDMVRVLGDHETKLRAMTEDVAPGWYAGSCKVCESGTYVVPGLTWVTCLACGSTTYARDHINTVLDEARGWVARPRALAETVVALVDTEMSVPRLYERIKKWGQRGEQGSNLRGITAVRRLDRDGDPTGPKSYRLGDVLDLIASEGQTTSHRRAVKAS